MAVGLITGFRSNSREALDKRKGPYKNRAEALASLDTLLRFVGLEVIIVENATFDAAGNYIGGFAARYVFEGGIDDVNLKKVDYSSTGLEAISEGNGIGWRLIGKNPALYGDVGLYAVDISESGMASTSKGATGTSSFAGGIATEASGIGSFAIGDGTKAEGINSLSSGTGTHASGSQSMSVGESTTAGGDNSAALGNGASAAGAGSLAAGLGVLAKNTASVAMGRYNVGSSFTNIFELGIGTDDVNRKNGLEVVASGLVKAPSASLSMLSSEASNSKAVITKEYFDTYASPGSGDKTFLFDQGTASGVWDITHNMGKRPSVTIMDSAGTSVSGVVEYIDDDSLKIYFNTSFSGSATLN